MPGAGDVKVTMMLGAWDDGLSPVAIGALGPGGLGEVARFLAASNASIARWEVMVTPNKQISCVRAPRLRVLERFPDRTGQNSGLPTQVVSSGDGYCDPPAEYFHLLGQS